MKVVVLGGYGNFGARTCRALAGDAATQLVVAGRDFARAQAFAAPLGADAAALDTADAGLAGKVRALGAQLVIPMASRRAKTGRRASPVPARSPQPVRFARVKPQEEAR